MQNNTLSLAEWTDNSAHATASYIVRLTKVCVIIIIIIIIITKRRRRRRRNDTSHDKLRLVHYFRALPPLAILISLPIYHENFIVIAATFFCTVASCNAVKDCNKHDVLLRHGGTRHTTKDDISPAIAVPSRSQLNNQHCSTAVLYKSSVSVLRNAPIAPKDCGRPLANLRAIFSFW